MTSINKNLMVGETVWLQCEIVAADYGDDHVTYKVREANRDKMPGMWVSNSNLKQLEENSNGEKR